MSAISSLFINNITRITYKTIMIRACKRPAKRGEKMSSPREAKLQLTIHARVNSITGETFKGKQSYAKIEREYKNDSEIDAARNIYIVVRESKHYGFVTVDYGYLKPGGVFNSGSFRYAIDLRSPQTQSLSCLIDWLFEHYILRDRRTATLRVLRPTDREQLFRRPTLNIGVDVNDVKLSSSPSMFIPSQASLTRTPALFASSALSSFPVTATVETVPDGFKCPITLAIMRKPVLAADGFNYEESSIRDYIVSQGGEARSPMDNVKPIQETFPNNELRNRIHDAVLQSPLLATEFWDAHSDAILNPKLALGEVDFADKFKRKYPELLSREEKPSQRFGLGNGTH